MVTQKRSTPQSSQHFSHPHILKLIDPAELGGTHTCNACELPHNRKPNKNFYGCITCQYFLHENCLNAPRFLNHPSHPAHHLTLLPKPTYPHGAYGCDACIYGGKGFSYACAPCQFDIHLECAFAPQSVFLAQHQHELKLIFYSSFDDGDENTIFLCDICNQEASYKRWLYYCADCDFGAHVSCGTCNSIPKPKSSPLKKKPVEKPLEKQENSQAIRNQSVKKKSIMKQEPIKNQKSVTKKKEINQEIRVQSINKKLVKKQEPIKKQKPITKKQETNQGIGNQSRNKNLSRKKKPINESQEEDEKDGNDDEEEEEEEEDDDKKEQQDENYKEDKKSKAEVEEEDEDEFEENEEEDEDEDEYEEEEEDE